MADKIPLSDLPAGVPGAFDKVAGVDTATGASRLFPLPQAGVPKAYATRASLPAAGGLTDGTAAWVTNDPNPLLNGTWSVQAGAWVQSADRVTGLEGRLGNVEAQLGNPDAPVAAVVGSTSYDEASYNSALPQSAPKSSFAGVLTSVSVRTGAGGGTGEISAYVPEGSEGAYKNVGVWPVTIPANGLHTFAAGGGVIPAGLILPAGSIVAYKRVASAYLRGAAGGAVGFLVSGDAGLGSVVSLSPVTHSNAISFTVFGFASPSIAERVEATSLSVSALEVRLPAIEQGLDAVDLQIGDPGGPSSEALGSTEFAGATFNTTGVIAGSGLTSLAGNVTDVSVRVDSAGTGEFHALVPIGRDRFKNIGVWPATFASAGVHTFRAGGGVVPNGVHLPIGSFIAFKRGTAAAVGQAGVGSFYTLPNDLGLGTDTSRTLGGASSLALAFALAGFTTPTIQERLAVSETQARIAFAALDQLSAMVVPLATTRAYALGDSTIAAGYGRPAIITLIGTARTGVNVAVPSQNALEQRDVWNALDVPASTVGWVCIQIGLNDLHPAEPSSVAITRIQALVDAVRAKVGPTRPVLISKMLPCKQRLIDLWGVTDGAVSQQKWVEMNDAIAGLGPTPIVRVSGRVTAHVPLLDDGEGNLAPPYDTGDHIHENTAGGQIIADAWKAALLALGVPV